MLRISIFLLLSTILFSACLVNSRIGYHPQTESNTLLNVKGKASVLIFSVPIEDPERVENLVSQLLKIDEAIDSRNTAVRKGVKVPTHIPPDNVESELRRLSQQSNYKYLIIVDGYPMPTENNGGNLVSTIIEVWNIRKTEIIYNSHSTVKSKVRMKRQLTTTRSESILRAIVGPPIEYDLLFNYGIRKETKKLRKLY